MLQVTKYSIKHCVHGGAQRHGRVLVVALWVVLLLGWSNAALGQTVVTNAEVKLPKIQHFDPEDLVTDLSLPAMDYKIVSIRKNHNYYEILVLGQDDGHVSKILSATHHAPTLGPKIKVGQTYCMDLNSPKSMRYPGSQSVQGVQVTFKFQADAKTRVDYLPLEYKGYPTHRDLFVTQDLMGLHYVAE